MVRFCLSISVFLFSIASLSAHPGHSHEHQHTHATAETLDERNWDKYAPHGKEVDAIYGDEVLANKYLTAVIANPIPTRNANMTVRQVGGCLIDLTVNHSSSDQLSCFYPLRRQYTFSGTSVTSEQLTTQENGQSVEMSKAEVTTKSIDNNSGLTVTQTYQLLGDQRYLSLMTTFRNDGKKPVSVDLSEDLRADGGKEDMVNRGSGTTDMYWFVDRYWGQAYGIVPQDGWKVQSQGGSRTHKLSYLKEGASSSKIEVPAGESFTFTRHIYPGANLLEVLANRARDLGRELHPVEIALTDNADRPVANAQVTLENDDSFRGWGRTDDHGHLDVELPAGDYMVSVQVMGVKLKEENPAKLAVKTGDPNIQKFGLELPEWKPGSVVAKIVDEAGEPIACKVEFQPREGTPKPYFGPETAEYAVMNLRYAPHGEFEQPLPNGQFDVIVSHGPEYDAIFTTLEITPGKQTKLEGTLVRSVKTPGWVSTEYHSHSSPSGDNTGSQMGRVLNLVCEHLEFAPCTEHNRIETYEPEIALLGIQDDITTVSGMELTGQPLLLNHQNVFPLVHKPRTQDGGGPVTDTDPSKQIERIFLWDDRSEKLIQQNHPDLGWLFYDANGDGTPDPGYERSHGLIDVMEIHPIQMITDMQPAVDWYGRDYANRMFAWLQLLNQGYRIPGVVNTDAHYNYHGSGGLRNWVQSSTDDPGKIDIMEMVHASEQGRLIMSNGPYLEFSVATANVKKPAVAGEDLLASTGQVTVKMRVQCANWLDINRVVLYVNGRPHDLHDYRRKTHANLFKDGTVKFETEFELKLDRDAHLIAVTQGEGLKLGPVMGPSWGNHPPTAVTNPVFIDIDGDGFEPNKDTLDHPLPVKHGAKK